jgi:hypothetical protein
MVGWSIAEQKYIEERGGKEINQAGNRNTVVVAFSN